MKDFASQHSRKAAAGGSPGLSLTLALAVAAIAGCEPPDGGKAALPTAPAAPLKIEIGIGTQNNTTNTVTGGIVLRELGFLEKRLPHTGKYQNVTYSISWESSTSGPPITNGMMANKLQIGRWATTRCS